MKKVLILGSTGSIGVNALDVISRFPEKFSLECISGHNNLDLLAEQITKFNPRFVVVKNDNDAEILKQKFGKKIDIFVGENGLQIAAGELDYDIILLSIVGFAGLVPALEGVKRGKRIAIANKETLVVAGEIITSIAEKNGSEIIPVDSEHNAIYQCLAGERIEDVRQLILTASGGPFHSTPAETFRDITVKQALNHPNWKMGNKITIDSATMMNKGFEVIEAKWLFNLNGEKIKVIVHPQSVVHSMVEFVDGSIKAGLSLPDMRLPIQYALTYPERLESNYVNTNFSKLHKLTFYDPDMEKFRCLKLAFHCLELSGTAPCILNAANEIAVNLFLDGKISFDRISEVIEAALDNMPLSQNPDIDIIFSIDRETRNFLISKYN